MRWVEGHGVGSGAAPDQPPDVSDHLERTDGLIFDRGDAPDMHRTAFALDRLETLD